MRRTFTLFSIFVALAAISFPLMAQGVRGTVRDSTGTGIPSATVSVEGRPVGVVTDGGGAYTLRIAEGSYRLKISSIGYETRTADVTVTGTDFATLDVTLRDASSTLQEIVVVGSRSNVARTNIETPVPVDVIGAKEIKAYAQTDVTQILNFIAPSFSSNRQTVADGTDHIDPASLRGLGPDQVLVLVNGKRRHTTALLNINGTFGRGTVGTDMNAIPAAAIERLEVLRDGAAAQYGSDAIAGVINIVLKKETPWTVSTMYGQSLTSTNGRNYTDGKTFQVDLSKGWALGQKGYVNVSGQYLGRGFTNRGGLDTRPLLYSALPTRNNNAGETEAEFQTRYRALKAADDARAATNGVSRDNMRVGNSDARNVGGFLNFGYKLAPAAEVYVAAGGGYRLGEAAGFTRIPSQTAQIDLRIHPNGFLPLINTTIQDYSAITGVRGTLGKWNYDLSNTWGMNSIRYDISNTLNASIANLADNKTEFYAGTLRFRQNTTNLDFSRRLEFDNAVSLNVAAGGEFRSDNYQIMAGEERSWSRGFPDGQNFDPAANKAAGSQVFPGFKPTNALNKSRTNLGAYADLEAEFGPRLLVGLAGRVENYSDFGSNFSYKATGRYKIVNDFAVRGAFATGFRAPSLHQRFFNNESTQFVNSVPTQVLTVNNDNSVVRQFGVESLKPEISTSYSIGLTGKLNTFTFTVDAYQVDIRDRIVFSSQYTRERPLTIPAGQPNAGKPNGVVNPILNGIDSTAQINSVQFFTNAISTTTRGLDVVLTDRININAAKRQTLVLSAAANFNRTTVNSVQGSSVIENNPALKARLFDRLERSRYESAVPRSKFNLSATFDSEKWNLSLRTVRFGEVTFLNPVDPNLPASNLPLAIDQTFAAKWVTDLTVSYKITKMLTATVGANNLFDIYPDRAYLDPRNREDNLSGDPATNYTTGRDNTSNGRFVYSRAVTQFGFNGRFVFARLGLTL